jgi:hypothetical protein
MTYKVLNREYKTPLAQVRGVFLCENVATASVLTVEISQEGWGTTEIVLGEESTNSDGDVWLGY